MNLKRLLNCVADNYAALRLAGFTPAEAERIVNGAFRDVIDRIPHRPYPKDSDHADRDCTDERTTSRSD